ncbi:MAG: transposase [Verrucomicrobia bacterium]|nr:transposase [Verrucomicrobiota bacterium]
MGWFVIERKARGREMGGMREKRVKIDPRIEASSAHLVSRTNNRERCFNRREKAKLLSLMRQAEEYCGLKLFTHAEMINHPHALAHNPLWQKDPDDAELIRRYRVLNPGRQTKYRSKNLEVIAAHLEANTEEGIEWRRRQVAQMGDFSQFMKIVKQRFTAWFNREHCRTGTIWGGRFKSVLVEENSNALVKMAAYIDNNPVRAGIVRDPKDYAHSGYGEAVAGNALAQRGIMQLMEVSTWEQAQAEYRKLLYAVGTIPKATGRTISIEEFEKVVGEGGKLSVPEILRCRIRRFTDSVVFGSTEFVAKRLEIFVKENKRKRPGRPRPMPPVTDWGGLATLRGLRQP